MAAFSDTAFSELAFDPNAFDFGVTPPIPPPTPDSVRGGISIGTRPSHAPRSHRTVGVSSGGMFSIADSNAFDELEQFKKRISADSESRLLRKAILAAEDEAVALIIICANL